MSRVWPKEWDGLSHDERRDDLIRRMFLLPPMEQKTFVGKSVRPPKPNARKRDMTKPKGFKSTVPSASLLAHIERVVPPMSRQWRDDLIQELAMAVITGEIEESALDDFRRITKYRNKVIGQYPRNRSYEGSDVPDSKKRLTGLLSDGDSHDLSDLRQFWNPEENDI